MKLFVCTYESPIDKHYTFITVFAHGFQGLESHTRMGVKPDEETLTDRLQKTAYSRLVKNNDRFPGSTTGEFYDFLRRHASALTDADIESAMTDYLHADEIPGLAMQFKAALATLTRSP